MLPTEAQRGAYYRGALTLLRFVEQRTPSARRFGPEADALWRSFAGDLDTGDRIELLLRDADRQWPAAFGARAVFALRAAYEADAFGADWARLPRGEAEALWKQTSRARGPVAADSAAALERLLAVWELAPAAFELPKIGPSSRLVVCGAGAVVASLRRFLADADLSWSDQVVIVADAPAVRQISAAAPALADRSDASLLLSGAEPSPEAQQRALAKLGATPELLASPDASPAERELATRLSKPGKPGKPN